jgi:hypothetical protein
MGPCPNHPGRHAVDTLSAGDVLGFQQAFGRKVNGSLVGLRGLCAVITMPGGNFGPDVVPWYCRGQTSQWLPTAGGQLECTFAGLCLSMEQPGIHPSSAVRDCADARTQGFSMTGVQWRAEGNLCVARAIDKLQTAYCDGSPEQRWDLVGSSQTSYGSLRLTDTNLCVTVVDPTAYLALQPCVESSPAQTFFYSSDGGINLLSPGAAPIRFNVEGAQEKPGEYLYLFPADVPTHYNEQFYFTGMVRSSGANDGGAFNKCLVTDPQGIFDEDHPNSTTGFVDCNDSDANQLWDYYFQ